MFEAAAVKGVAGEEGVLRPDVVADVQDRVEGGLNGEPDLNNPLILPWSYIRGTDNQP